MPWFSYHGGHSGEFCRHARGPLEGVVKRAIEEGFTHYGLSEHAPRYRDEDLFPGEEDLGPAGLEALFSAYQREAIELRDRYADRIEVLIGFETERLPPDRWESQMRAIRQSAPFDYMIGSVHDVDGQCIDYSPEWTQDVATHCGGRRAMQLKYFDALADLVSTLRPEVVGHIDLIRKFDGPQAGFDPDVMTRIEQVLAMVREVGAVLDVNPGAHRRGLSPVYPLPEILERAHAMDVGVTLGDDGHGAHDVGAGLDHCMEVIAAAGYRQVHYLTRVDGEVQLRDAPIDEVHPREL